MKKYSFTQFYAWSLFIFLLCALPAYSQTISSPQTQQSYTAPEVLQQLAKVNVIYLGESHDSPEDHQAQLEIIQELYRRNRKIAIAMEMFQRPYQGVLDRYLAGKITETQLIEQSEYKKRWGFSWEYYAPILGFAKEKKLPVLALNTPSEVTRKVARKGLESLTAAERRYIPPDAEIRTDNPEYRQMVQQAFQQHQVAGHGSSANFERFFTAQVLWDETMADAIAQFLKTHPDYQVVVLAGQAHIVYGYGIPSRVARRLGNKIVQRSILLNPTVDEPAQTDKAIADYFWVTVPDK
ncbi:ChaN family lipoprotein [Coleofasciculus sp. FACHB-64]|uniref:ChaN family lipoprotein n=1 Tax=Cyanophyceae TaxID=3028117 RepID=UPI001686AE61|nr:MULTISPECIES: ChaN family lipoprotein [unclassified Coleofasciculus]MBD1836694.1 ChaN family lipoprotein [Coleofasciculus sp. FACHB-501]MBD2047954.1 ChaN family lipoprotein [Coleofasciculus sp. FACHB-64]